MPLPRPLPQLNALPVVANSDPSTVIRLIGLGSATVAVTLFGSSTTGIVSIASITGLVDVGFGTVGRFVAIIYR